MVSPGMLSTTQVGSVKALLKHHAEVFRKLGQGRSRRL
jgi:hypothetical protein